MEELKVGDVVQLKSGGPGMTVTGVFGEEYSIDITTIWYNHSNNEFFSHSFLKETLTKVTTTTGE